MADGPRVCGCGADLPPGREHCSSWCQTRAARGLEPQSPPPLRPAVVVAGGDAAARAAHPSSGVDRLADRVTRALEAAGLLETWEAGSALDMARAIDAGDLSGAQRAVLHRELRALLRDVMRGVDEPGSRVGGMRDELAARRARRVGGGGS